MLCGVQLILLSLCTTQKKQACLRHLGNILPLAVAVLPKAPEGQSTQTTQFYLEVSKKGQRWQPHSRMRGSINRWTGMRMTLSLPQYRWAVLHHVPMIYSRKIITLKGVIHSHAGKKCWVTRCLHGVTEQLRANYRGQRSCALSFTTWSPLAPSPQYHVRIVQ